VGVVMRANRHAAISADRDRWTKKAYDVGIAAFKDLIGDEGPIRPTVPIGRLTTSEHAWIVSTVISAWVRTRSEQAASEGWNYERAAHATQLEPDPWIEGAVASVLPKLVDTLDEPDFDWSKPVAEWPKDHVIAFLLTGFNLISHALAARDAAENPPEAGGANPDLIARELNAAGGNPKMTVAELRELNDSDTPF
jgi:hypothetical protein